MTNHLADAPPEIDAPVDAASAPVTVTVLTYTNDGLPNPGAIVVFSDSAGNLIADGSPDANGKISAEMPMGGNVTSIQIVTDNATTLTAALTTITDVKPGDDLTIGVKAAPTVRTAGGQTTMTANFTPNPNAGEIAFYTECGSSFSLTSPVTLNFRDSCHGASFDLLMVESGGNLVAPVFTKVVGIAHSNQGTFTIPAGTLTSQTFTANLSNLEANVSSLTTTRAAVVNNTPFGGLSTTLTSPAAGGLVATAPFVQGVGTRSLVTESWIRADASVLQRHEVVTSNLANSLDIDLSANRLPWLSNLGITAAGMTWTTVAPGAGPDGMVVQWSGHWTTDLKVSTSVAWRVARAAADTGGALIKLPAKYARFDPSVQTTTVTPVIGILFMVDYDALTGYDDFKKQPDTLILPVLTDVNPFGGMATQRNIIAGQVRLGLDYSPLASRPMFARSDALVPAGRNDARTALAATATSSAAVRSSASAVAR